MNPTTARALHWFHSKAFRIDEVCQCCLGEHSLAPQSDAGSHRWGRWLSSQPVAQRLQGQLVYLGDGIKVGKEGRKMPGVKLCHLGCLLCVGRGVETVSKKGVTFNQSSGDFHRCKYGIFSPSEYAWARLS